MRAPATPSCKVPGQKPPWIVVERCDLCECFEDDFVAALSLYKIAGWFQCCDGGWHVLADIRSRRKAAQKRLELS